MKDKKKMMIVALLAFVVVGVGAFQFMGGSGSAPVSADKKKDAAPTASPTAEPPKNPAVAAPLAERDPFEVPKSAQPPVTPTAAPTPTTTAPRGSRVARGTDHIPVQITGEVPGGAGLPNANGGLDGPLGPGGKGGPAIVAEPQFGYQVVGVMVGSRPCAVFADSQGNQRLVPLGGSLDNDTKVTGIEKGQVTVRFHNKTLRFGMGGNPSAK